MSVVLFGIGNVCANEKYEIKTIKKGDSVMHLAMQDGKVVSTLEYNVNKRSPSVKLFMPDSKGMLMNLYNNGDLIESIKGDPREPDTYWWVALICISAEVEFGSAGWNVSLGWDCPFEFNSVTFSAL